MSLNEITTLLFSVLTLIFAVWGFTLFARLAHRAIRALDVYIAKNGVDTAASPVEKEE